MCQTQKAKPVIFGILPYGHITVSHHNIRITIKYLIPSDNIIVLFDILNDVKI